MFQTTNQAFHLSTLIGVIYIVNHLTGRKRLLDGLLGVAGIIMKITMEMEKIPIHSLRETHARSKVSQGCEQLQ